MDRRTALLTCLSSVLPVKAAVGTSRPEPEPVTVSEVCVGADWVSVYGDLATPVPPGIAPPPGVFAALRRVAAVGLARSIPDRVGGDLLIGRDRRSFLYHLRTSPDAPENPAHEWAQPILQRMFPA